jgi:hypothetical protein
LVEIAVTELRDKSALMSIFSGPSRAWRWRSSLALEPRTRLAESGREIPSEEPKVYVSRLLFHTVPGKTGEVEKELRKLREMVTAAGGNHARILHTHFASLGAPDAVFEQDASDLAALEQQIGKLTGSTDFQSWSHRMSTLLTQSPKREVYIVED